VGGHKESLHHLEFICDEGLVALHPELLRHLLRQGGPGIAQRPTHHGLADTQHGCLH
jgi:hypothetical protein